MKRRGFAILILACIFQGFPFLVFAEEEVLKEIYLRAFNLFQQANAEQRTGNLRLALEEYQGVQELIAELQKENPEWQKSIVDYLKEESARAIQTLLEFGEKSPDVAQPPFREEIPTEEPSSSDSDLQKMRQVMSQQEEKLNQLLMEAESSRDQFHAAELRLEKEIEVRQKMIDELKARVKRLENENLLLQLKEKNTFQELQASAASLAEREREVLLRETTLRELRESSAKVDGEMQKLRLEIEKEKTSFELQKKSNEEKLQNTQNELARIQQELSRAKIAIEEMRMNQEKAATLQRDKTSAIENERDLLREKISSLSIQFNQKESEMASLQAELLKIEDKLKIVEKDLEKERLSAEALKKDNQETGAQRDQIQGNYDRLVRDYQKTNEATQVKLAALEKEKGEGDLEASRLKLAMEKQQKELQALRQIEAQLKKEREEILQENARLGEKTVEKEKLIAQLKRDKSRAILSEERKSREKQLKGQLETERTKRLNEVRGLEARLSRAFEQAEVLKKKLGESQDLIAQKEQALVAIGKEGQGKLAVLQKESQEKVAALQRENQEKLAVLQKESQEQIAILQMENQERVVALNKENQEKMATLEKESEAKIASLEAKNASLEAKSVSLDAKSASLEAKWVEAQDLMAQKEQAKIAAEKESQEKIAALQNENQEKVAVLQKENQVEIARLQNENQEKVAELLKESRESLEEQQKESQEMLAGLAKETQKKITSLEAKLKVTDSALKGKEDEVARIKKDSQELIVQKEQALVQAQKEYEEKLASLEREKGAVEQKLITVSQRYDGMVKELNLSFDKVKNALETKLSAAQQVGDQSQMKADQLDQLMVEYKKKYENAVLNLEKSYENQLAKLNQKIALMERSVEVQTVTPEAPAPTPIKTEKVASIPSEMPAAPEPVEQVTEDEKQELIARATEIQTQKGEIGSPVYNRQAVILYNQGVDLAEKGEIAQAELEFKKAIQLFEGFFEARYNLGRIFVMQGKKKEAIEQYTLALSIREDPDVFYGLGAIYWEMADWEKVVRCWEEVLRLNPQHSLASQWLPRAREKIQRATAVTPQS